MGEFVFDQIVPPSWTGQLGLRYYPKLLEMSTGSSPVQGYASICGGEEAAALTALMLELIDDFAASITSSVAQFLLRRPRPGRAWRKRGLRHLAQPAEASGAMEDFKSFDGTYLASFNANQRTQHPPWSAARSALAGRPSHPDGATCRLDGFAAHAQLLVPRQLSALRGLGQSVPLRAFFDLSAAEQTARKNLVLSVTHPRESLRSRLAIVALRCTAMTPSGTLLGPAQRNRESPFSRSVITPPIECGDQQGFFFRSPGADGSHKRRRGFWPSPAASLHRGVDPVLTRPPARLACRRPMPSCLRRLRRRIAESFLQPP